MIDNDRLVRSEISGPNSALANASQADLDPALAELFDELTQRIQDGEPVDPEAVAAQHPAWAGSIRQLLPALVRVARAGKVVADAFLPGEPDREGRRLFGDFQIDREIGRGGMGVVYEARQLPIGRRVALKILPPAAALDSKALQRFQLEAQVAGLLQHPGIVPVYAVGTIGGVPYYAMQYVEGRSLADIIAELRSPSDSPEPAAPSRDDASPGALAAGLLSGRFARPRSEPGGDGRRQPPSAPDAEPGEARNPTIRSGAYLRTVARLGIQAAEALGYAHDQGVTHRDVKPANLLLDTKGTLWLADLGMADVQGGTGLTLTGDLPGTLRYMSPEQALGHRALVDRRTDIYAIGATLYELLILEPAVKGADKQEILRRIAEDEPEPVRRLNPAIPVDLATIVHKALARDPSARYETARKLADDLGRFLDGRPIAARPVGPVARAWRWCRRKPAMAGLAAALVTALLLGFAGISWNWREAVRQRNAAESQKALLVVAERKALAQADRAEAINRFLIDKILGQAEPGTNQDARRLTVLEALDRAADEVGRSFADQPETEAAIRMAIGNSYHGLGQFARSEPHFRAAWERLEHLPGGPGEDGLAALAELGHALFHQGQHDPASEILHHASREAARILGGEHLLTLRTLEYLASTEMSAKRYAEAEALNRQVQDVRRRVLGPKDRETVTSTHNLGLSLLGQKRYLEAERLFRECSEAQREALGPLSPDRLTTLENLARTLEPMGRLEEAEALLRECIEGRRKVIGPEHPYILSSILTLASVLEKRGRFDEAESLASRCVEVRRRSLGPDHADTVQAVERLAKVRDARAALARPR
ncbi:serine/threonine-protein kinase [Aquisphaera insulae]|uniref:serine/threonine-protein kinase n=1 Tax=Aquisphaera insulae TaxID=2712864 RepID=UPI0013EC4C6E|nr:serine/threonine-protein kinase [Aquisphaera insulae]